jgi:peptide/nickel transport system ATP-binding protein
MYLGEIVEIGTAKQIIKSPQHPYTKALVSSVPVIDPTVEREKVDLVGEVPDPVNVPSGCRFHPRCPQIVQPDSYDLEQQNWRAIVDLRQKLEEGDIDSDLNPEDIRDEYDLPNQLSDADAESVLTEALAAIDDHDVQNGREILASSFTSPCESEPIPSYRTESGQTAKCVLLEHDDSATIE